jgi:hypothetical protein
MSQKCGVGHVPSQHQIWTQKLVAHRLRLCIPLLIAVTVIAATVAGSVRTVSTALAAEAEPFAQYTNILETFNGMKLAGLYVTSLGDGASEGKQSELTWTLNRLPCPGKSYRFLSLGAAISSSQTSRSEALVRIITARLPRGIHCGTRTPLGLAQGSTKVTVSPTHRGATGSPSSELASGGTEIKSFSACLLLSELCTGKFRFAVYFTSPTGELVIRYRFEVSHVRSITTTSSTAPDVMMNAMGGLQCSVA